MAWDSIKEDAVDPNNPSAVEKIPASEWNAMVTYIKTLFRTVAGTINALTTKGTPVADDVILIEDSADGYAQKKVLLTDLLAGGGAYTGEHHMSGQLYTTIIKIGVIPEDSEISEGRAIIMGSLPEGQSVKVDIRKNGTLSTDSIFTSDVPIEITTSHTPTNDVYIGTGTLDSGQTSCSKNDVFYAAVTQVGSTYAGSDLFVQLVF